MGPTCICKQCGEQLSQQSALKRHTEERHPSTGQSAIGEEDCRITRATLTGNVDQERRD